MHRILPGDVAWFVTRPFYAADYGTLRDAGYFLHPERIDGDLFIGEPGSGDEEVL
jgi:hypothetical protein